MSRSAVYRWYQWYQEGGDEALRTKHAPGAPAVITPLIEAWLNWTVLHSTPVDHGYDTELWTLKMLVALIEETVEIRVSDSTVAKLPAWNTVELSSPELSGSRRRSGGSGTLSHPHLADDSTTRPKKGAVMVFLDEDGLGVMTRSGRTWGEVNALPIVPASDWRGGYNVLSAITPEGELFARFVEKPIESEIH